jgi:hypothetical protein
MSQRKTAFGAPKFPSPYANHAPEWNENAKHIGHDKLKKELIIAGKS